MKTDACYTLKYKCVSFCNIEQERIHSGEDYAAANQ